MPIKLMAASRRRPGLTRAEYQRYLEFVHGTIACRERFKIDAYIQNHVIDGAFGVLSDSTHQQKVVDRDAVVELYFNNFRDMLETLEPATPSAASQDGKFFADECTNIIVMAEEEEIPVPHPLSEFNPGLGIVEGVGALKVMHYIMRDDEVFPEDYHRYWRQAHEYALEKAPYAKYFYEEIPQPDPAHVAMMDAPCDPVKAIYPAQLNDLLDPGDLDVEIGWCNLSNGAGFIANRIIHPDATAEMVDWWFAWHPLEDLRYRIWYPPQHAGIMVSPENRKRLLDDTIPMSQRNWGVVHHMTENCDCGMENITITFMSPRDFGLDMTRYKEPHVATFAGGSGWAVTVDKTDGSITAPALMCHIFRNTPDGLEHRTRFWMGYRMSCGKPELTLPPGLEVPTEAIQGLARHNVEVNTSRVRSRCCVGISFSGIPNRWTGRKGKNGFCRCMCRKS